jgi:TonB family protein
MINERFFSVGRSARNAGAVGALVVLVLGCAAPAPVQTGTSSSSPSGQATRSSGSSAAPTASFETSSPRTLSEWKRSAAERIQAANRTLVYAGAPPNPLRAVVVVEMTVSADGQVRRAELLRAPGHAKELGTVALKTVNAASPLPAPPKALLAQGSMKTTETWLFRDDGQFRLRSLALAQAAD